MLSGLWIIVLIKDFDTAKSRLAAALEPSSRRALAEATAVRALDAAVAVAPTLAVCGSADVADLAAARRAGVVVEAVPSGQNAAAALGVQEVVARGAEAALLLSSDLPLVDEACLRRLLAHAAGAARPLVVAAAALGRQGTNALFLRPPGGFDLRFGEASLPRFAEEARLRRRRFVVHEEAGLALDIDEPADLSAWQDLKETA
jgi:2-phospho-L-lactate guanylyltransferase